MVQLGVIQNVKIQKGEDIYPVAWFQRTVMHRTINRKTTYRTPAQNNHHLPHIENRSLLEKTGSI